MTETEEWVEPGGTGTTVNLSLISHTNAGKTTLARTLLGRDVGEVRDTAHVTDMSSGYVLVQTGDDTLMLWDTPGFGDTARLLSRLRMKGNPVGWLLTQIWDRWRERPLWSSQQAVRNAREHADVVLYLVNAAEDPAAAAYVALEMEVLGWIGKPVLLLLNQMGPPRSDRDDTVERWLSHVSAFANVTGALPLDAFARCWVQEGALLDAVMPLLPVEKNAAMKRLSHRWKMLNFERFSESMDALATSLSQTLVDNEEGGKGNWFDSVSQTIGVGARESSEVRAAIAVMTERLVSTTRRSTDALIRLHGLDGEATASVLERVDKTWLRAKRTSEGTMAVLGGIASGAVGGLAADLAAGGLTLGGGMIVGSILGALGAGGLARGINIARGDGGTKVRWSLDMVRELMTIAVLRYLAVAHFGRGRGKWEEGEYPVFWQNLAALVLERHADEIAQLHERSRRLSADDLTPSIHALLSQCCWLVLKELYPEPVAKLGESPAMVAGRERD